MSGGRCAGCGLVDNSCKKIDRHILTCPDYLKLFREQPEKCLRGAEELVRWNAEDNSQEAKDAAREVRLAKRFAEMDQRRLEQVDRWQGQDLLA